MERVRVDENQLFWIDDVLKDNWVMGKDGLLRVNVTYKTVVELWKHDTVTPEVTPMH